MRTKKQIEKMMIGMLLGGGCLLSSCHSVHMSAEDRLQGDYQEAAAEVELETVEELTAFAKDKGIDIGQATSQEGIIKKIRAALEA